MAKADSPHFRTANHIHRGACLILLAVLTGILGACGGANASAPNAPAAGSSKTAAPSSGATQAGGVNVSGLTGTVLGTAGQAFVTAYGPLTSQSDVNGGDLHFRQYAGVAQDALIVQLGVHFGVTSPGDRQAYAITAAPAPSSSWTMTQAETQCAAYRPSDAQQVKTLTVTDSTGTIGEDVIYRSVALAHAFPASAFTDANQNPVTPGTFDISYLYQSASATDKIASCELQVGSQQTS